MLYFPVSHFPALHVFVLYFPVSHFSPPAFLCFIFQSRIFSCPHHTQIAIQNVSIKSIHPAVQHSCSRQRARTFILRTTAVGNFCQARKKALLLFAFNSSNRRNSVQIIHGDPRYSLLFYNLIPPK